MNILRLEAKFVKLDEKQKQLEYTFNPNVKSIPGLKRHRFFQDISRSINKDDKTLKMSKSLIRIFIAS